jgi:MFS transporter, OFA family, oxalate/formate antiporter
MILTESLLLHIGSRICALIGGQLFGAGWMLAGLAGVHFGFTLVGIGILAGVGVGFAYIVPIATCSRLGAFFSQYPGCDLPGFRWLWL